MKKPTDKYRDFVYGKDIFPGLPPTVIPVYILEEEQWTFVWGFDDKYTYMFEWDKVSPVYNFVKFQDKISNPFPYFPETLKDHKHDLEMLR